MKDPNSSPIRLLHMHFNRVTLKTGNPFMGTLANSKDPGKMLHELMWDFIRACTV